MRASRFGLTGKVLAKADREVDPYTHIDHVREEVFDLREDQDLLAKRVSNLEAAERNRVTETGVWAIVKNHFDEKIASGALRWAKWALHGGLIGLGAALWKGAEYIWHRAFP